MSTPFTVRHRFSDVDELRDVSRRWDVDFRQLERGSFEGRFAQWVTPTLQLARGVFSRQLDQRGAPPRDLRTVAIPMRPEMRLYWRGHHVSGHNLLVFPLDGELECVSAAGFDMLTVSVEPGLLDEAASAPGQGGLGAMLEDRQVLTLPPGVMRALRQGVAGLLDAGVADPAGSPARLHAEVPRALLRALSSAREDRNAHAAARVHIVRRAISLIRDRGPNAPTVSGLCKQLAVTERTLERGFREVVGVTPKSYIQAQRLIGVRRVLRGADPSSIRIADVANEWGFWHMGQFAADYRRHFGELPSETVARRAGVGASTRSSRRFRRSRAVSGS